MVTKTDGETSASGNPLIRTLREDAAVAAMQGLLSNTATVGSATEIAPTVTFMAVLLADQLIVELAKEKQS
jgi:hypothetical protein